MNRCEFSREELEQMDMEELYALVCEWIDQRVEETGCDVIDYLLGEGIDIFIPPGTSKGRAITKLQGVIAKISKLGEDAPLTL
jgi:hypothetical protein